MKVNQLFSRYKVLPNIQDHLLNTASFAYILTDNWKRKEINKNIILESCLVHDIANIIKADLDKNDKILKEEIGNIEYWRKVKIEYINRYGRETDRATQLIAKEIGLSPLVNTIIQQSRFLNTTNIINSNNWELKVVTYSDFRIGPYGIVLLKERFREVKKRYRNKKKNVFIGKRADTLIKQSFILENQIQDRVKIDIEQITQKDINRNYKNLLGYNIPFSDN